MVIRGTSKDLSVGPAGDQFYHSITIQVKGVDAHRMILGLEQGSEVSLGYVKSVMILKDNSYPIFPFF